MTKHTYRVIDPNGVEHTRTTHRVYTHAVFTKPSLARDLEHANAATWVRQDRDSFRHYSLIAAGDDPFPPRCTRPDYPGKWTPEEIEEERLAVEQLRAQRLADAKEKIAGLDEDSYVAMRLQERLDQVEKRRQDGFYEAWENAGWCGNADLAERLATTEGARSSVADVAVLEIPQLVEA